MQVVSAVLRSNPKSAAKARGRLLLLSSPPSSSSPPPGSRRSNAGAGVLLLGSSGATGYGCWTHCLDGEGRPGRSCSEPPGRSERTIGTRPPGGRRQPSRCQDTRPLARKAASWQIGLFLLLFRQPWTTASPIALEAVPSLMIISAHDGVLR